MISMELDVSDSISDGLEEVCEDLATKDYEEHSQPSSECGSISESENSRSERNAKSLDISTDSLDDYLRKLEASLKFDSPEKWLFLSHHDDEKAKCNIEESGDEESDGIESEAEPFRYLTDSSADEENFGEIRSFGDNSSKYNMNSDYMNASGNSDKLCLIALDTSPRRFGSRSNTPPYAEQNPPLPDVVNCVYLESKLTDSSVTCPVQESHWNFEETYSSGAMNRASIKSTMTPEITVKISTLPSGCHLVDYQNLPKPCDSPWSSVKTSGGSSMKDSLPKSESASFRFADLSPFRKRFWGKKSVSMDTVSPAEKTSVIETSERSIDNEKLFESKTDGTGNRGIRKMFGLSRKKRIERPCSILSSADVSGNNSELVESAEIKRTKGPDDGETWQPVREADNIHNEWLNAQGSVCSVEVTPVIPSRRIRLLGRDENKRPHVSPQPEVTEIQASVTINTVCHSLCNSSFATCAEGKLTSKIDLCVPPPSEIKSTHGDPYATLSEKENTPAAAATVFKCEASTKVPRPSTGKGRRSSKFPSELYPSCRAVPLKPPRKSEADRLNEKIKREEKAVKRRARVIQELFDTETTYQRHLELIVRLFEDPLIALRLLDDHVVTAIFANVKQILGVNAELRRHLGATDVGRAFLEIGPFLKVYSSYANNHERALATLMEWDQKSAEFSAFRRRQEECEEMNNLKLNALLITPVQRIPRYKLLLEELLATTPADDLDYIAIQEAVSQVSAVASHINEHIRQQDNRMKMLAIQRSLACSVGPRILTPGRMFVKEGLLKKVSAKGGRSYERMFYLFSDMLMYAKPRRLLDGGGVGGSAASGHSYICCCILPLHHCRVQRVLGGHGKDGQGALFTVQCKQESLLLYSDQKTVGAWVTALTRTVEEQKVSRQTLRKTSSAKQPVRRSGITRLWKREGQADPLVSHVKSSPQKSRGGKPSLLAAARGGGWAKLCRTPPSPASSFFSRHGSGRSRSKFAGSPRVEGASGSEDFERSGQRGGLGGGRGRVVGKSTTPIRQLWDNFGCLTPSGRRQRGGGGGETIPLSASEASECAEDANQFSLAGHQGTAIDLEPNGTDQSDNAIPNERIPLVERDRLNSDA